MERRAAAPSWRTEFQSLRKRNEKERGRDGDQRKGFQRSERKRETGKDSPSSDSKEREDKREGERGRKIRNDASGFERQGEEA